MAIPDDALTADPDGIRRAGVRAGVLAADLDAIRRRWRAGAAPGSGATGSEPADRAVERLTARWDAEFEVYLGVLTELSAGLDLTATTYADADRRSAVAIVRSS